MKTDSHEPDDAYNYLRRNPEKCLQVKAGQGVLYYAVTDSGDVALLCDGLLGTTYSAGSDDDYEWGQLRGDVNDKGGEYVPIESAPDMLRGELER